MNLKIVLTVGHGKEKKVTTLRAGDTLLINKHVGTAGFLREGRQLCNLQGDDKFITRGDPNWSDLLGVLHHFGICADLFSETGDYAVYELTQSNSLKEMNNEDQRTATETSPSG